MKTLVTCEESGALDSATKAALALSSLQLMEKASLRIWDKLASIIAARPDLREKGKGIRIVALCGKGDNGGDALAILRHAFSAGYRNLEALVSAREMSESAKKQWESVIAAGMTAIRWIEPENPGKNLGLEPDPLLYQADIIIDGILGTGLKGPASGEARSMIERLNALKEGGTALVVSVDMPSGLGDGWRKDHPCVIADITLGLEPVKAVCYLPGSRPSCGDLIAVSDVFPENLVHEYGDMALIEDRDLGLFIPRIENDGYKMSRGRLAIFAGSIGSIGAAQLCAKAALASGAGYVTLYVDEAVYPVIAPTLESVVVKPMTEKLDIEKCDAILAGPGWGQGEDRLETLKLLLGLDIPLVLDADAIRILASHAELLRDMKAPCIVTPHSGEFTALAESLHVSPETGDWESMRKVCESLGMITVFKSHTTWMLSPRWKTAVYEGLTPELGTAGTGDVLAGILVGVAAGKMAQMKRSGTGETRDRETVWKALEDSASCAVIAHGRAGKRLALSKGWFESSDLAAECSLVLHEEAERARAYP